MFVVILVLVISSLVIGTCGDPSHDKSTDDGKTVTNPTPIVLWHGLLDSSHSKTYMTRVISLIKSEIPGVYIKSLRFGYNAIWDRVNTVIMDVRKQVDLACKMIGDDPQLKRGYHALGISQGGQFLRAVAQKCPDPPMFNLISLGGQQQGIYGLENTWYNPAVFFLGKHLSYSFFIKNHIVQAQNWHDPINHDKYVITNNFIADINRENNENPHYRDNLLKLKHLVLFQFFDDEAVVPRESSWFGFYKKGQAVEIEDMADSTLYKEDKIGLKELDDSKRLQLYGLPGKHLQISDYLFKEYIVRQWLAKTYWETADMNN